MMFKGADVTMDTVFGDASQESASGSIVDKLAGAGKRLVTGESLFTHTGLGKTRVASAAPYPGRILAIKLDQIGGRLICQKDALLCAARGVSLDIFFQKRVMTGLFGGEGVFFARISWPGRIWLQSLPFSRLAGRIAAAMPAAGGAKGEGSIPGGIGNIIDGDKF